MKCRVQCDHCKSTFSRKHDLERHIISCHIKGTSIIKAKKYKISCERCKEAFTSRDELAGHLISNHGEDITCEPLTFTSVDDFETWKKRIETENYCRYVQKCGAKKSKINGNVTKYFYCHRDGKFRSRAPNPRKRLLKSQGSNKINNVCPSRIIFKKLSDSGAISVTFINNHVGHGDNTGRLTLTEDEKAFIAGKIKAGVPFDDILDSIYNNVKDIKSPIALTEKQQLRNIVRDFDLNPWKAHLNDVVSVDVWVSKVSSVDETINPLLFYKRQNEEFVDDRLAADDILLVIANPFQREMLLKFGNGIVCTDTTHGVNEYDFHLTTLLVVDEYGAGIPVAFCISNKKDTQTFSVFYEIIKNKVGEIHPKVFMTDDDHSYYNAWQKVMGSVPKRLLCAWHVDKSWRSNLTKIDKLEKRAIIYKALRVLLQEVNTDDFETLLSNFIDQSLADPETKSFAQYFDTHYTRRNSPECWAYCYRRGCGINTNMRLESVHKIVKYFYLNGKKNKRLDRCIDALMKYIRDLMFRRLRRKAKNKRPALIQNVLISHQKALTNDCNDHIQNAGENFSSVWYVRSFTNKDIQYTVELLQNEIQKCTDSCLLVCEQCSPEICVHTFSCECIDYLIKNNICKHIHAIVIHVSNPLPMEVVSKEPILEDIVNLKPFVEEPKTTVDGNEYLEKLKTKAVTVLGYLSKPIAKVPLSENDYLELNRTFDKQLTILSRKLEIPRPKKSSKCEPANKNVEKQKRLEERFKSTKKKSTKTSNNVLKKPTSMEIVNLNSNLLDFPNVTETVNIHTRFDHSYT